MRHVYVNGGGLVEGLSSILCNLIVAGWNGVHSCGERFIIPVIVTLAASFVVWVRSVLVVGGVLIVSNGAEPGDGSSDEHEYQ